MKEKTYMHTSSSLCEFCAQTHWSKGIKILGEQNYCMLPWDVVGYHGYDLSYIPEELPYLLILVLQKLDNSYETLAQTFQELRRHTYR
jgi:hypothetical protein